MLRSGQFSDLTLVCQGEEFKIHRVVACPQSPVLSAAISGEFKESLTGVIEIEHFDSETVRRMVEYLYTGNYDSDQAQEQSKAAAGVATSGALTSASSSVSTTADTAPPVPPAAASTQGVLSHVRVNAIGDYYGIQGLMLLANQKIQQAYQNKWDANAFLTSAKEALDSTGDKKLHRMMALLAAQNLNALIASPQLADLVGDFAAEILRFHAHKFEEAEREHRNNTSRASIAAHVAASKQHGDLLAKCQAAEAKTGRVLANIGRVVTTMGQREYCRNNACEAEFGCYLEQVGDDEPTYVLRCTYCRCRH
ncbi:hypothetical protein V8C42DRAFT_326164 [Trichoderma barbatum]